LLHFRYRLYNVSLGLMAIVAFTSVLGLMGDNFEALLRGFYFDRARVLSGEVWRLVTYNFIPSAGLFSALFRVLATVWFLWPVEREWGSPRFLFCYGLALLGASLTALMLDVPLLTGWAPETALFLCFGLLHPHAEVLLMFFLPFRARTLGLLGAGAFLLVHLGEKRGVPHIVGFCLAMAYFRWETKVPIFFWLKRRVRRPRSRTADPAELLGGVPEERLGKMVREIINLRRFEETITPDQRLIVEEYIRRIDPGKELCSPDPDSGEAGMCPPCRELGVCMRRFLEGKKDAPKPS
jgi:membrane associated rhomboid family serine protease